MTFGEIALALVGAGGFTAIVQALLAARTARSSERAARIAASSAERLEDRKLDMAYYKDIIGELRASLADERAGRAADRDRYAHDLEEERAIAAGALASNEVLRAERDDLRARLVAAGIPLTVTTIEGASDP